jgi:hypothetical protein
MALTFDRFESQSTRVLVREVARAAGRPVETPRVQAARCANSIAEAFFKALNSIVSLYRATLPPPLRRETGQPSRSVRG